MLFSKCPVTTWATEASADLSQVEERNVSVGSDGNANDAAEWFWKRKHDVIPRPNRTERLLQSRARTGHVSSFRDFIYLDFNKPATTFDARRRTSELEP